METILQGSMEKERFNKNTKAMKRIVLKKYFLVILYLLLTACSGTKHLPKGEKLYAGADVIIESSDKIDKKKVRFAKKSAESALYPKPNSSFLGMRFKLWRYMAAGDTAETKLKKWMKKTGEAPVFIGDIKPMVTSSVIDAKLYNIGIFKSNTIHSISEKKHTAKIIYTSYIHQPFKVKELNYAVFDSGLSRIVIAEKEKSLIKPGEDYSLDKLKNERNRIDFLLKNSGYFYFDPDFLLFIADTSETDKSVTFRLTLKDSVPQQALTVYRINNVFIDQAYSLNERAVTRVKDTLQYDDILFLGKERQSFIRQSVISRSVFLKKNEVYSRKNHNTTLNRLMSMGNFKFVSIKFTESDTTAPGFLDVTILMTAIPKYAFKAGLDIVSKSNNYSGPRMNVNVLNRNAFKGAELLNYSLAGSWETQLSGKNKNLQSYSLNPKIELIFPRFIVPFNLKQTSSIYLPKTRLSLSYDYLKRGNYFDMNSLQFIYGFKWKEDIRKDHELNPVNVSYTAVGHKSDAFNALLESNQFLKKSYEDQFIAGANYIFTFNEQVLPDKTVQTYFQLTTEVAGNAFSLANVIAGKKISSENPTLIANASYSQFARMSLDGRTYYNFPNKNKFAFRAYAGLAIPYGNSSTLPYIKQFFSGGPNSIRAFSINTVGPGIYNQNTDSLGFLRLGGDVKLELNAEYRFNIFRFLKGAIFTDAGNVWLLKSNPSTMGSPFSFSGFAKEIAVGAGFGLRIDVSFFLLRFDLAMPLRKPWLEGNKWVMDEIDFGSPSWRSENLILNVAIGYPF
ncbi:MAG: BamA/TamA family outer membrane protein [Bacteroidales bacterium]|nr:BamA/TamA family outer membrane protein [Bacteroidales bacterium]